MHPLKKRIVQLAAVAALTTPVATSCNKATEKQNISEDKIENVVQSADELLLSSAQNGDFEAVKNAIEKGANVNAQDSKTGKTALMLAYEEVFEDYSQFDSEFKCYSPEIINKFKIMHYLVNHKDIDLNILDYSGANFANHINAGMERQSVKGEKFIHPGEIAIKEVVEKKMAEQEKTNSNSQTAYYMNYINQVCR